MINSKLTSVKVLKSLYKSFKISNLDDEMTLQKLTNRSIYLYLKNEDFRKTVQETTDLTISGSTL